MSAYIGTFERKEVKYRLDAHKRSALVAALGDYMIEDQYGCTRIDSVYFDTNDHQLIARSLEKPLYKEKLRVRSYGPFDDACVVFVEIKKKFKGIVYKRRVQMTKGAAESYLLRGISYEEAVANDPVISIAGKALGFEAESLQIAREIDAFCKRYRTLSPAMLISCQRVAYEMRPDRIDVAPARVTFDTDISYRNLFDARHRASNELVRLMDDGESIMELKVAGAYPLWLTNLLTVHRAFPSSFSKYGSAYRDTLAACAAPVKHAHDIRAYTLNERNRCA